MSASAQNTSSLSRPFTREAWRIRTGALSRLARVERGGRADDIIVKTLPFAASEEKAPPKYGRFPENSRAAGLVNFSLHDTMQREDSGSDTSRHYLAGCSQKHLPAFP
jgi:hypothetical protein